MAIHSSYIIYLYIYNNDGKKEADSKERKLYFYYSYLYNGIPASSLNHNTMYTLSLDGADSGHGKDIRLPSTAVLSIVFTIKKREKRKERRFKSVSE